jgi:hypothetical protein
VIAATVALTAPHSVPAYSRLVSSAHSFRQHFRDLENSGVNPIERVVFSLVLAHSGSSQANILPAGRT